MAPLGKPSGTSGCIRFSETGGLSLHGNILQVHGLGVSNKATGSDIHFLDLRLREEGRALGVCISPVGFGSSNNEWWIYKSCWILWKFSSHPDLCRIWEVGRVETALQARFTHLLQMDNDKTFDQEWSSYLLPSALCLLG